MSFPAAIDQYTLLREVGEGAMGVVYEVRAANHPERLALKWMKLPASTGSEDWLVRSWRARFAREVEALSWLDHPHIVRLHGHGTFEERPYYVMEFLDGPTLREELEARGVLSPAEALRVMDELLDGLQVAHRQGIVHRDLKPGNIVLAGPERAVKLTDFGVAKMATDAAQAGVGERVGTISYMCPQLLRGEEVDVEADIFSCGVILHRLTAGRRPFEAADQAAIRAKILAGQATLCRELPAGLQAVIARCLAAAPEDRYRDAAQLREALRHWAATKEGQTFAAQPRLEIEPSPLQVGLARLRAQDPQGALPFLQRAVMVEPDNFQAQMALGVACGQVGYHDVAVVALGKALELKPGHVAAVYNLGLAYRSLGRDREARRCLEAVLRVQPDHADARQALEGLG